MKTLVVLIGARRCVHLTPGETTRSRLSATRAARKQLAGSQPGTACTARRGGGRRRSSEESQHGDASGGQRPVKAGRGEVDDEGDPMTLKRSLQHRSGVSQHQMIGKANQELKNHGGAKATRQLVTGHASDAATSTCRRTHLPGAGVLPVVSGLRDATLPSGFLLSCRDQTMGSFWVTRLGSTSLS